MKMHSQLIDKLLNLVDNFGGHQNNAKLRKALAEMDMTPYTRENTETILVDTEEYLKKVEEFNRSNKAK